MIYKYLVTVIDNGKWIERIEFTYKDEALYFAEQRRKQGFTVTVKPVVMQTGN